MYHLAITTDGIVSLALFKDEEVIHELILKEGLVSDEIVPLLSRLFLESNIDAKKLNFITINQGPGYFTAIRAGIAVAKMLAISFNIPAYGFSSSYILANTKVTQNHDFLVTLSDIGKIYPVVAIFNHNLEYVQEEIYLEKTELINLMYNYKDKNIGILGQKQDIIMNEVILSNGFYYKDINHFDIKILGKLGLKNYNNNVSPKALEPLYIKGSNKF